MHPPLLGAEEAVEAVAPALSPPLPRGHARGGAQASKGAVVRICARLRCAGEAREVPLDKLVLETDSPYLTPVPFRGKPNKPAYVKYVAEEIAKIREMSYEELVDTTTTNAERFFGI